MKTATALSYDDRVAALAAAQDCVTTRRQLSALGIGRGHVRNQVRAGRWRTAGQRVVILHTGPLTPDQERWAAVLGQTSTAALGGISAAQAHGLVWMSDERLHVIVPEGSRIVPTDGVIVHASRTYRPAEDLHPGSSVPRTRIERAIVDGSAWAISDRRACGLLCASVQQGLVQAEGLLVALAAAGPIRRRHLIALTVGDIQGGAQSLLEIDFGTLAEQAGLPRPRRQVVRLDAEGKRRYIDVDFDFFDVEVDGAIHLKPASYWDDMHRQNELTIAGAPRTLRFSTVAIRLEPEKVVSQLRRAAKTLRR